MNKPLILLDVDETVIDVKYNLTCRPSEWRSTLRLAEARGAIIGLNSDSAYEMLKRRAKAYGVQGPIVAERGALVSKSPDARVICTNVDAMDFQKLLQVFMRTLTDGVKVTKYLIVVGHVNEIASRLPALPLNKCLNDTAVLINSFRSCSLSFFVRRLHGRSWTKDAEALNEVIGITDLLGRKKFPRLWEARDMDKNPDYGICIFHHRDTKKSLAYPFLRDWFGERDVYMIGNSMSDYIGDVNVKHCAVANASEEFKDRCVLVANHVRTRGVIELIGRIMAL